MAAIEEFRRDARPTALANRTYSIISPAEAAVGARAAHFLGVCFGRSAAGRGHPRECSLFGHRWRWGERAAPVGRCPSCAKM